jgi:hypothetical protein
LQLQQERFAAENEKNLETLRHELIVATNKLNEAHFVENKLKSELSASKLIQKR